MMKKILIAILIAWLVVIAFFAGRSVGVYHAITDSVIYTVEVYNPENPEENAWNGYDQTIYIELDNQTWVHGMYQG